MSLYTRCDPCIRIDENVLASKWCVDCEDALCITCAKSHKGNTVSMTHHVIDMEVISTLTDEVLTTQTKCSRHPDCIMDFFCNQHHVEKDENRRKNHLQTDISIQSVRHKEA